ncbi:MULTISPECIES: hypothetical protein [unclassified Streptomyces]|uniref:hypothetical protein n=1 Tax=unclassified Streptomyces TaxID=2593676 RepID=UPI0011E6CD64|nr:hypothetical protein [Streptomyces sp. sk2.1]TXS72293.1 hypothetical protein EAO76_20275 [Streptomyces sp. sk2.1]
MFAPAAGRPWRDAWPPVARTGDGNAWVTGSCWLYCRREGVRVLWIGSVNTPGATGDVYACGPCLVELDRMVRSQTHDRDTTDRHAARPVQPTRPARLALPAHTPPAGGPGTVACEHRQTENRAGKTFCRACERQLYL